MIFLSRLARIFRKDNVRSILEISSFLITIKKALAINIIIIQQSVGSVSRNIGNNY